MTTRNNPHRTFAPQAMLDAGDTDWSILQVLLSRRIEELPMGGILEIVSRDPAHCVQLMGWCRQTQHDCFQVSADGDRTWFWIKKR